MRAIINRELRTYFLTPLGYIYTGLFLLITGVMFTFQHLLGGSSYFSGFFGNILFLYLFAVPLLTMRLLSEERRQRTDQLLLTSPISLTSIVVGKFLAAFFVFMATIVVTMLYALVVGLYGDLIVSHTIGSYIGFLLMGASFISVGVLISAASENQVNAAFFTFFALLVIFIINLLMGVVPQDVISGAIFAGVVVVGIGLFFYVNTRSWIAAAVVGLLGAAAIVIVLFVDSSLYEGLIVKTLNWFNLLARFDSFSLGIVKLETVVFYLSFTGVFLFITMRLVEKRRWA